MLLRPCIISPFDKLFNLLRGSVKWQTTSTQRSLREVGISGVLCDFFDRMHVVESLRTLGKKREMKRHIYLWIFMVAMALYTFQRDEKPMMYLYTQLKFDWDTVLYSNFKTFQSSAYVIMMLAGIPLMSKVFGWPDTVSVIFFKREISDGTLKYKLFLDIMFTMVHLSDIGKFCCLSS